MRKILMLVAVLYSGTAIAQTSPPAAGEKPAAVEKPATQAKPKIAAAKQQSIAVRLQACLAIDDVTKERLDCYDAVFPPKPKPKAPVAKSVADCRFTKEEDERLKCFNGFVERLPKPK